ncbi:hypothetical protein MPPM_0787 [Methylorubrum populi]|uniref:Uncharacterized protein n=1 Tax=Methylorubrum populi TaxID=223967 RepID=A0A169QPE0_9HYPH|nr:hypothetical protein MPPM_0787 [Methylorubrum populi]
MRLIRAYHAMAHVRLAVGLLHLSLGFGWLGEWLWHQAKGQMDRAAEIATRTGIARQ